MDTVYFDRAGHPITFEEWAETIKDDKRVAKTNLPGEVWVSTVWLGINHNYGDGPPLIFETMIFGGPLDDYQRRYSTEEEAIAGHKVAVRLAWLHWAFPTVMGWLR